MTKKNGGKKILPEKKRKKCYSLSFPIFGGCESTRALQSSPFQNPGGVAWAWQSRSSRSSSSSWTVLLISNIGLPDFISFYIILHLHPVSCTSWTPFQPKILTEWKQACCAGCRRRPFTTEIPSIGKIHQFIKTAVTFEPVMRFGCPSRFRIS